ncbi:hypothetical protein CsatB_008241 [Cannabis sativa]|uniref:RNA methyltransferase At5g10620 n=1 Tax=Cannabis sativa TaxID=3483 RepID=A0A803QWC4_CANSA|nr:putative RNA methyltransferase At5g10620 isoform X1 [Cannabis sativa]XP_030480337.1 putative RNA methyltransferase At5g10620 isoform X1 [Cannabis sativa]
MATSLAPSFRILCSDTSPSSSSGKRCKYVGQSVRALPIRILWVGKKRSQGAQLVFDEYFEKIKLYCTVNEVQIRSNPKNSRDWKVQVEDEDNAVMNLIRPNDWVVLLDERGRDLGSEEMADLLGDAGNTGASGLSFCIGGPYGHGQRLRERANLCIKLSSMVFNHQIALLVLVEQLYRSWTILKGQKYHH